MRNMTEQEREKREDASARELVRLQVASMDVMRGETTWLSTTATDNLMRSLAKEAGEVADANDLIRSLGIDPRG